MNQKLMQNGKFHSLLLVQTRFGYVMHLANRNVAHKKIPNSMTSNLQRKMSCIIYPVMHVTQLDRAVAYFIVVSSRVAAWKHLGSFAPRRSRAQRAQRASSRVIAAH